MSIDYKSVRFLLSRFDKEETRTMVPRVQKRRILILLPGLLAASATVAAADGPAQSGLQLYLDRAAANHPDLERLEAAVETARAGADLAGALPGLKVGWGEMLVPVETRVGPQQRVWSISQGLPWPGTLGERKRAGRAEAQAGLERLRARRARIAGDVRAAWYHLALVQRQRELVAADLALARQAEVSERARYETGEGTYRSVLQTQMRSASLASRISDLDDRIETAAQQLRAAAAAPRDWPVPSATLPTEGPAGSPDRDRLLVLLEQHNPDLAALRWLETSRRHGLSAADKTKYPDLSLGVDFIRTGRSAMDIEDSGKDPVVLKLGATLPLWGGRVDAARQAAAGRLLGASSELRARRLQLEAALDRQRERLQSAARRLALLHDELIPRARQMARIVEADLASGRVDLSDLLAARSTLLELETDALQAAHDEALARSELSVLLDMPWSGILPPSGDRKEG